MSVFLCNHTKFGPVCWQLTTNPTKYVIVGVAGKLQIKTIYQGGISMKKIVLTICCCFICICSSACGNTGESSNSEEKQTEPNVLSVESESSSDNTVKTTTTTTIATTVSTTTSKTTTTTTMTDFEPAITEITTKKTTASTTSPYDLPYIPQSVEYIRDMKVTTDVSALNIRCGPGYDYKIIGEIPKGTTISIFAEVKNNKDGEIWAYLNYNGVEGWSTEKYLSNVDNQASEQQSTQQTSDIDSNTVSQLNAQVQSLDDGLRQISKNMYVFDYGSDGYGDYSLWIMWNDLKDFYQLDHTGYLTVVDSICDYCREIKRYLRSSGYPNSDVRIFIGTTISDDNGEPFEALAMVIENGAPDSLDMRTQFGW